jgi:hypothetical protein
MAYIANKHTVTNKSLGIAQAVPTDARSFFFQDDIFQYRHYQDTTEVLAYLNTPTARTGNFPIFINSGTLDAVTGTFSGGSVSEYWFKDGTADTDLVEKTTGGGGNGSLVFTDMVAGDTTYQNNTLKNKTINYIIVNKIIETLDDDFTFDDVTGTIDRTPNQWQAGDKLIVQL